jgi:N-glycosylase/DNA lyase
VSYFLDILTHLVDEAKTGRFGTYHEPDLRTDRPDLIARTLATCILSSGWRYEKASYAADRVVEAIEDLLSSSSPETGLEAILRLPKVGARFPKARAGQLAAALKSLRSMSPTLVVRLNEFGDEFSSREYIVNNFDGLGLKQSSMFLRDIGMCHNLAVIDTHVIWYMENIEGVRVARLDKAAYLALEHRMLGISDDYGMSLQTFDQILWVAVREFKKFRKRYQCGMQYALPLGA